MKDISPTMEEMGFQAVVANRYVLAFLLLTISLNLLKAL
jgi:hypothetical protein